MIVVPVALDQKERVGRSKSHPSASTQTSLQELYDAVEEVSRGKVEGLLRTGGLNVSRIDITQIGF